MMIRRTLEVLCHETGCTGNTLHQRLGAFRQRSIIGQDLLEAMDVLKVLGNDAAHVDARDFDQVEQAELDVAIELTKELIRAVYQHRSLVDKLKALKRPP